MENVGNGDLVDNEKYRGKVGKYLQADIRVVLSFEISCCCCYGWKWERAGCFRLRLLLQSHFPMEAKRSTIDTVLSGCESWTRYLLLRLADIEDLRL